MYHELFTYLPFKVMRLPIYGIVEDFQLMKYRRLDAKICTYYWIDEVYKCKYFWNIVQSRKKIIAGLLKPGKKYLQNAGNI